MVIVISFEEKNLPHRSCKVNLEIKEMNGQLVQQHFVFLFFIPPWRLRRVKERFAMVNDIHLVDLARKTLFASLPRSDHWVTESERLCNTNFDSLLFGSHLQAQRLRQA